MRSNEEGMRRQGRHGAAAVLVATLAAGCGGRTDTRVLGVAYQRPAAVTSHEIAGAIVGVVTSGGQPISGAELTMTGPTEAAPIRVRTSADGTYRFVDVPPGEYRVQAVDTGGSGAWCADQPVCITDRPGQAEWRRVTVDLGAVVNAGFSF